MPGGAPDWVVAKDDQTVVLDVQVVLSLKPLSELYTTKTAKYMNKEFLQQLEHERPLVSTVT